MLLVLNALPCLQCPIPHPPQSTCRVQCSKIARQEGRILGSIPSFDALFDLASCHCIVPMMRIDGEISKLTLADVLGHS